MMPFVCLLVIILCNYLSLISDPILNFVLLIEAATPSAVNLIV